MKSESIYPLTDTDSTRLPEEMECKAREGAVVSKCSASSENNSIDEVVTLKKDDFEKICRCCLSHETIANIFYLKFGKTFFVDLFFKLLGTRVNPNDSLPKNICTACVAALVNFYNFKKTYNNSLATLLSVLGENQVCNVQHIEDDINEDIKEEMSDIHISEDELDIKSLNENINNIDSTESTIFKETQKSESTISDDPNKILADDEELCTATNESFSIPQLEDDTENEQFKMENSDINVSEKELDEEFQYESNEKENTNGAVNNESATYLSPEKHKQKEHKYPTKTKRSYVCEICGKSFLKNASLKVHYRIHKPSLVNQISAEEEAANPTTVTTEEKRMNTCYCGEVFSSSKVLARHKTEKNHLDELDTKCEICNKVVKSQGLSRHMRAAHKSEEAADVKLDCSTCGKIFKNRQCLLQHLKIHGEKKLLCAYCGKRFHDAATFKTHCLSHTGEKPFSCNECGQKFRSSRNLRTHMHIHTGVKPYVCKFCHKTFRQPPHLKAHLRTHTGEKPFKCPYCDKSFRDYSARVAHIRSHTGEKPYTCDTCGETFSTGNTYRNHLVMKHQQEKNSVYADVQCKTCNKFYSSKQALKSHMLVHGEKRNLCTYCGKSFHRKAGLDAHSAIHITEKKFSCSLCDKKFSHLMTYKQHQYIHTGYKPYTCKICSKKFRQGAHLVAHVRTHTGEKPYGCPYCDKTFAHYTTRIIHIRSHTGERPYVCDVCSKGFYHSSSMTKHRQTHFKKVSTEATDGEATE